MTDGAIRHRSPHPDARERCGGCRLQDELDALRSGELVHLDSEDFRDRHERAFRDHILGVVGRLGLHDNAADDHACDDLCSAAILDRLVGKKPVNEYARSRHDLTGRTRVTDIRPAADWSKP